MPCYNAMYDENNDKKEKKKKARKYSVIGARLDGYRGQSISCRTIISSYRPSLVRTNTSGAVRVRWCLAQGHLNTWLGEARGSNQQPSRLADNLLVPATAVPSVLPLPWIHSAMTYLYTD